MDLITRLAFTAGAALGVILVGFFVEALLQFVPRPRPGQLRSAIEGTLASVAVIYAHSLTRDGTPPLLVAGGAAVGFCFFMAARTPKDMRNAPQVPPR